jgi:hypothetical protein
MPGLWVNTEPREVKKKDKFRGLNAPDNTHCKSGC